jgi:general secretion pathway protein J
MKHQARGFTLIELVVAMLITAILFAMGYGALQQAFKNRTAVEANAKRLEAVQYAVRTMVQDFSQLAPRPVRETIGEGYQPALVALVADATQVTFTRGGWANPAGIQRSNLQRVRYVLEDGKLRREHWLALDVLLDPPPRRRELLDGVRSFKVRFMNDGHNWQDSWPPNSISAMRSARELRWRPIAVEVTLELEDWGRITRIIEVAG